MPEKEKTPEKEKKPEGMSRRTAVQTVGGAVLGLAVGAAAGWLGKPTTPAQVTTVTETATATMTGTAALPPTTTTERDYYYDPSLSGTTISFLSCPQPDMQVAGPLIAKFTTDTGIAVNVSSFPEDTVQSKAAIMMGAKSGEYDIVDCTGYGSYAYAFFLQGWVEDLATYVENKTPSAWNKKDILSAILNAMTTSQGQIPSLPSFLTDFTYFYRNDIIQQAPSTIDELIADAQKANNPPSVYGFTGMATPNLFSFFPWEMFFWGYGGKFFDENYLPQFNTDAAYNATKSMYQLSKSAPAWTTTDMTGAATIMMEGKAAQSTNFWSWWFSMLGQGSVVTGKLGYAPHPGVVSEPHMLAGITRAINKFSQKKDAAWSFLSWFLSPTTQQALYEAGSGGTIRESVLENPRSVEKDPDSIKVAKWVANAEATGSGAKVVAGPILPWIPRVPDFLAILVSNLAKVYGGTLDYKTAMDQTQTQTTDFMRTIGLYKG
jgi:multiple sugar transport system substrate-binding protein